MQIEKCPTGLKCDGRFMYGSNLNGIKITKDKLSMHKKMLTSRYTFKKLDV